MPVMEISPVRLVLFNPETEVREKQRFIGSEFDRQGSVHEMGMGCKAHGHSEPS
jgi:hypothetical protein